MLNIVRRELAQDRRCFVYCVYTNTRDITARLNDILTKNGIRAEILRSKVKPELREEWLREKVDQGVQVIIGNPILVQTGLDLLDFPTIVFYQTGYSIFTLRQASRRSWRIGQKQDVEVRFLGYANSAQMACLKLMAKKIAVSQSTSGDMPDCGLDILNQDGDSIEVALAKQLIH